MAKYNYYKEREKNRPIRELSPERKRKVMAEERERNEIRRRANRSRKKEFNDQDAEAKTRSKGILHPKRVVNEVKYQGKRLKKLLIGK